MQARKILNIIKKNWLNIPDVQEKCPECNGDYNHMNNIHIVFANDDYESLSVQSIKGQNSSMHQILKTVLPTRVRGKSLVIEMLCELCHSAWVKAIFFHKGQIFTKDILLNEKFKWDEIDNENA